MSCTGTSGCNCGCCLGISVQTPQGESNLPGLPAITYRTGTWATFKESMLARLSSFDYPALSQLKTRDDDDFSIALLDASAVVLDILTFYQERLANESYLRTATQLRSLTELARLIGYAPAPGIAASVYLAFSLQAAPGLASDPSTPAITIPKGTQVQSVPPQGQSPQTFETSADILAKADWNALPVQTGVPWVPNIGDTSVYLEGTSTQLQPGDLVLIVGDERLDSPSSNNWDVRLVTTVTADSVNKRTYVVWSEGLGYAPSNIPPAQKHPKFYAFRQRAALFGYNAVNPLMLADATITNLKNASLLNTAGTDWKFGVNSVDSSSLASDSLVDLDAVYSKIVTNSWLALIKPDKQISRSPAGLISLFLINSITSITRSDYAMSAKISRLATDTQTNLSDYYGATRSTSAVVQSEQLVVAEQPLDFPLYGNVVDLETLRPDLIGAKAVALSGKSQKLQVNTGVSDLQFQPDDSPTPLKLNPGDVVTIIDPTPLPLNDGQPDDWSQATQELDLRVADASGRTGTLHAALTDFTLAAADKKDPDVEEFALVSSLEIADGSFPHTRIHLTSSLVNCYDRTATTVNANVGLATQGRSVSEVLGNGAAATPNQSFTLKQQPLTYVQAPTPSGGQSTLQVMANGVTWKEVPTLYQKSPTQQVFTTLNQADGTTEVLFGDGVEGATLPTGQNNVQANYRVGSGLSGNVAAGSITTLVDRPLGVNGVNNPEAATGGQDPQSVDDIRSNAPLSVLTLGRAVSITDYQNYASTFAGITNAYAIWIPSGPGRGVFLTVAGAGGVALPPGNPTLDNLVTSLQDYGNPLVPIHAVSFLETLFSISADLDYDPAYDRKAVEAQVRQSLTTNYSFANRNFGQGVSADEVAAFIQAVPGVIAVNVTSLQPGPTSKAGDISSGQYSIAAFNNWLAQTVTLDRPDSGSPTRICPFLPIASFDALPQPAEILVLNPDPKQLALGVMA